MSIQAASSHPAADEERQHDQDGQLYTKVEFIGEYGGLLEWERAAPEEREPAAKPGSKQAKPAKGAKAAKHEPTAAASPGGAGSKDEQVLAAAVRILHGAEQPDKPMLLSKFFQKLYAELGADAKEEVQKRGGAIRWLKSVDTHLLFHKATGVGDEAVSLQPRSSTLQPRSSVPEWAAYLE